MPDRDQDNLQSDPPSPALADGSPEGGPRRRVSARRIALATVCVVGGVLGSVLAASSIAGHDRSTAVSAFQQSSTAIASSLKLSVQREEELTVSASTFFARNPKASPEEFATWVKWAQTVRRFPELQNLGLVAIVKSSELDALEARITGQASAGGLQIAPTSNHSFNCLATAELVRNPALAPSPGLDYCARSSAPLTARNSGRSTATSVTIGHAEALASETPVYRGEVTPLTVAGRTAAFVGWLREVLVPSVMLEQALRGHPTSAMRLHYHAGASNATFLSGTPGANWQSTSTNLRNGWSVRIYGAALPGGILGDEDALALLIAGCLGSVLLGLLVLGFERGRMPAPVVASNPVPNEDLYDPLTGLPNRALTLDRAERMVARAGRQSGMLAGALYIDIDWFKDVNDKLGQAAGDQLLKIVAERLEGVIRAGDTVGRFGGDEFVVLVESAARGIRLDSLARRVIEALHKPVEIAGFGPSFSPTASIGVAFGRYDTPDDLLRDAQLALTSAKAAGKDRYTLFNANMRSVIESRSVLEAELNTALQEQQFFLLYEPIYDMRTRRVVGLEAVLRWQHPTRGVLLPEEFVSLAEDTELIVPIGRWALEEACIHGAAWNVAGHGVAVSVKVSPNQLLRDGFATDVRRALQQSGIDPGLLSLEVAETTAMRDLSATAERLEQVKRMGVRVAIDDFGGSGYARHSDLQRLPLDALKVDRASLARSEDEDYRSWLLEAILIVGRELSLTVIATGIETREQLHDLHEMGCTIVQGPLMGKAASANEVERLITPELPAGSPDSHEPEDSPLVG
ncbi:MAG TPA: bifunctional diguanylate cyclase/phosphodiesterase [Solirubrobacteraceae bacterium]|nr:bifunctional diguanylate cyclase/phosphodiesterase [Solirubrobacteraceae bacterium]